MSLCSPQKLLLAEFCALLYVTLPLQIARRQGIRNILALRGDPPRGDEYWVAADTRFQRATDLVAYIQQEHGDIFCVGVAAYPEGYCDSVEQDVERDVRFLKAKQDAGAQFAITQLFYDADVFLKWYQRCREAGKPLTLHCNGRVSESDYFLAVQALPFRSFPASCRSKTTSHSGG